MMASGMNGQSFTFHGYLPIEKEEKRASFKL
jgi:16S rRNA (cytidine1402-2'-O)-methyltransferase